MSGGQETLGSPGVPVKKSDDEILRAVLEPELRRVYDRIEKNNETTSSVVQYIILVFGAVLIAASDTPAVFVFVPIFWTVWMLHARVIDFNTLKLSIYAAHLERRLNQSLPKSVYFWESRFTQRGNEHPFIFNLNFGYWGAMNAASWIGGIAVLVYSGYNIWSTVLSCLWVALWVPFLRDVKGRDQVMSELKLQISQGEGSIEDPIKVPTDPAKTHTVLLVGSVVAVLLSAFVSIWTDDPGTSRLTISLNVLAILSIGVLDLAQPGVGRILGPRWFSKLTRRVLSRATRPFGRAA